MTIASYCAAYQHKPKQCTIYIHYTNSLWLPPISLVYLWPQIYLKKTLFLCDFSYPFIKDLDFSIISNKLNVSNTIYPKYFVICSWNVKYDIKWYYLRFYKWNLYFLLSSDFEEMPFSLRSISFECRFQCSRFGNVFPDGYQTVNTETSPYASNFVI